MRYPLLAAFALATVLPAAADEPYLDDRSHPEALIHSLYNAISRKEYSRAWSYFSKKPAASLQAYADGYADTESIQVAVGIPSEHNPDGTSYYYVPVAIEALTAEGDVAVYGGCYELRLRNPQLQQAEEFSPLYIEEGRLDPHTGTIEDALPATCDDGAPPDPSEVIEQRAISLYRTSFGKLCDRGAEREEMESHSIRFRYSYGSEADPESEARLFRFLCGRGAYNQSHVYIMADPHGELEAVSFAAPELDIRYFDDEHADVEVIHIIGYRASHQLVNSEFDPATLTLTSWAKWRGVGDASSVGTWIFRNGQFTLTRFEVDASYDGEINPETILDYHSGP